MKYIRGAVESLEKRDEVTDEFMSILEDILSRGLSLKETMTVIMDLMLGGIDTVTILGFLKKKKSLNLNFC